MSVVVPRRGRDEWNLIRNDAPPPSTSQSGMRRVNFS